jgi:hypothetical protein
MIKDRGIIKWTAMMLPEHVQSLKNLLVDEEKIQKPILDEQEIEEIETIILGAMECNQPLIFQIYDNGFITYLSGTTQYIDHTNKKFRVRDDKQQVHYIKFCDLMHVQNI